MAGPIKTDKTTQYGRPIWKDENGEEYSERTITLRAGDGNWYNVPTVGPGGKLLDADVLTRIYERRKENLVDTLTGTPLTPYKNVEEAEQAARQRSDGMGRYAEGGLVDRKVFLNRAEEIAYNREQRRTRSENDTRGNILPLKKGEDGQIEFALPQWMRDAWNAISLPSDTIQGHQPTEADLGEFMMNTGGGGMSASSAIIPDADVGMFIGRKAVQSPNERINLRRAESLEKEGHDRDVIWSETGWFKGPDEQWRTEISDEGFDLNSFGKTQWAQTDELETREAPFRGIAEHPELFDAYPDMAPMSTTVGKLPRKGDAQYSGRYNIREDTIFAEGRSYDDVKSVLLHEAQHAIQQREGWSGGSNPAYVHHIIEPLFDILPPEAVNYLEIKKEVARQTSELSQIIDLRNRLRTGEPTPELDTPEGWGSAGEDGWGWIRGLDKENQLELLDQEIASNAQILDLTLNDQADAYVMIEPIADTVEDVASMLQYQPFDWYQRNAGEAEARLVQKRAGYTAEERANIPPWQDLDVPEEELWDSPTVFTNFIDAVKQELKDKGYADRGIEENDLYGHLREMRRQ